MTPDSGDRTKKADPEHLTLPTFDPNPSGKFAHDVLKAAHVNGVLIGRLAVWHWIPEESEHAYTKDLDIAVTREGLMKVREWLNAQGMTTRELPIGGVNVKVPKSVNVDFINRGGEELGNLAPLYEDAVREAKDSGQTIMIGGETLHVVTAEHLVAMKIATMERKDEEDAERLLQYAKVDVEKLRRLVATFLGPLGPTRLENVLRTVGHPQARPRRKYNGETGPGKDPA